MSVECISWAFKQNIRTPGAKLVLVALANCANDIGECYPSQRYLSRHTSQGERTVRRHLDSLEKDDFISRRERRRDDGSRTSDLITLSVFDSKRPDWPVENEQAAKIDISTGQNEQTSPAKLAGQEPKEEPKGETKERARATASRKIRKLEDLCLDEQDRVWARKESPDVNPERVVDTLRDYCLSRGKAYKDYRATWRNWMRNEQDRVNERRGGAATNRNPMSQRGSIDELMEHGKDKLCQQVH